MQITEVVSTIKVSGENLEELMNRLEENHLLICGDVGMGKTIATQNIIMRLLEKGKKILLFERLGEYNRICSYTNGNSVGFDDLFSLETFEPFTKVETPDSIEHEIFLHRLNEFIQTGANVDYLIIEDILRIENHKQAQELLSLCHSARKANIKLIFVSIDHLEKVQSAFPLRLMFDCIDLYRNNFHLNRGEAVLHNEEGLIQFRFTPIQGAII